MITKKAIEKAIEGAWEPCEFTPYVEIHSSRERGPTQHWWFKNELGEGCGFPTSQIVLMPSFWQALGKALVWGESELWQSAGGKEAPIPVWHLNAMTFYDLVLHEGDTQKFWDEILGV